MEPLLVIYIICAMIYAIVYSKKYGTTFKAFLVLIGTFIAFPVVATWELVEREGFFE